METQEIITKTKWMIDRGNSSIGFRVKHLMFTNVKGSFKEYDASIYTTENDFSTAEIDFWLNSSSIDTGNEQRDAHLRSEDFFDAEKFKEINFTGNTFIEIIKNKRYMLYGELGMKGIKKQIRLEVESGGRVRDPWGTERVLFNVTGKINRKDWGLSWNAVLETGGVVVSEEVYIQSEVQLIKQS
jgi:polyisoprenoid-binding protein YceI